MSKQLYIDLKKIEKHLDNYTMSSGYHADTLQAISFIRACIGDVVEGLAVGAEDFVTDSIKDTISLFFDK
jgi:hypothetical protein